VNWNIVGLAAVLVAALACIKDDRGGHVVCRNHDTVVFDGPVKDVFLWSVDGSTVARIEKPDGSRVNIEGDAGKVAAIETWKLHVKLLPTPQPCCWCGMGMPQRQHACLDVFEVPRPVGGRCVRSDHDPFRW
jgi:hypothetical protein